jgi:hypothetical protein
MRILSPKPMPKEPSTDPVRNQESQFSGLTAKTKHRVGLIVGIVRRF